MKMTQLVVFVLALIVAMSQAYVVVDTYADENCNTTLIARYISNIPCNPPKLRSTLQQQSSCNSNSTLPGVNFIFDYTYCNFAGNDTTEPSFPEGWQYIKYTDDTNCNFTNSYFYAFGAPQSLTDVNIAVFTSFGNMVPANTSMSCAASGVLSYSACLPSLGGLFCLDYNLNSNTCTVNSANTVYALQTSCTAPPVSEPSTEPITNEPMSVPVVASPVKTPLKAPTARASNASLVSFGSAPAYWPH